MRLTIAVLSLSLLLIAAELSAFDVSSKDIIGETTSTLDKVKELFDSIKESDLYKTFKEVKEWGEPLLESLSTVADIIGSYFEDDSKEMKFMKEQFNIINEKMDFVDQQFEDVKRLLDWNVIKIQFQRYESSVAVLQDKIIQLSKTTGSVKRILIEEYGRSYEQIYGNAAENIYSAFTNPNLIFTENLISAIRKYTKEDQGKVEKFFLGNIQFILKALEVETFYLGLKNFTNIQASWKITWDKNLQHLVDVMKEAMEDVVNSWKDQYAADVESYNGENSEKSVEDYAKGLYTFLSEKFKNRIWMVLVYDPLTDNADHDYNNCEGVTQMQRRGKNILVNSVGQGPTNFDKNKFSNVCKTIPDKLLSWGHGPANHLLKYYVFPPYYSCSEAKIAAVIRSKSSKYYLAPSDHVATCRWAGYYNRLVDVHKTLDVIVMG